MAMNGEFRAAEQVLRGMKRNDRQAVALQRVLDEVKHQHEDVLMYERWADESPTRIIECACGSRWQVRIADHEIGEAVPTEKRDTPDADQIERWRGMEERARIVQQGTSETMAGAADYILGEGAGK